MYNTQKGSTAAILCRSRLEGDDSCDAVSFDTALTGSQGVFV